MSRVKRFAGDRPRAEAEQRKKPLVPKDAPMTHGGKGGTKGTFSAAATKAGKGVQEYASDVLSHKDEHSPEMVKKANFARNASRWKR